MLMTTLFELSRVMAVLGIVLIGMPALFMKKTNNHLPILDRVFYGFTMTTLYLVVGGHLLALVKLFDVLSAFLLLIFGVVIILKKDKMRETFLASLLNLRYQFIDVLDTPNARKNVFKSFRIWLKSKEMKLKSKIEVSKEDKVFTLAFVLVFFLATSVRFVHALKYYAYPHLDMYLHLKWIKALATNHLYSDGLIYPKAMHAVIAFIKRLSMLDPYWILRFFGPFFSIILLLALYNMGQVIVKNRYVSLLSLALFGLVINESILPSYMFRQTATMPQEFGMVFIIIGYTALNLYFSNKQRRYLHLFEACLLISLMSHSFSGLFLVLWAGILLFVKMFQKQIDLKESFRFIGLSIMMCVFSLVPLLIGKLMGNVFHQTSIAMVTNISNIVITDLDFVNYFKQVLMPKSPLFILYVYGSTVILIASLIFKRFDTVKNLMPFKMTTFVMYMMYHLSDLIDTAFLPELLGKSRIGPFLSLFLPLAVSVVFYQLYQLIRERKIELKRTQLNVVGGRKSYFESVLVVIVLVAIVGTGNYSWQTFYRHVDYDEASKAYVRIKNQYNQNPDDVGNWYIVSTDPQYAEVSGYGWYDEAYNFVHAYSIDMVSDPEFRFDYPVDHLYVFVEKEPIFEIEPQAIPLIDQSVPELNEDPFMQFYDDALNRAIMEAHIKAIMEAYLKTHDDVSVYYEDASFMIYLVSDNEGD